MFWPKNTGDGATILVELSQLLPEPEEAFEPGDDAPSADEVTFAKLDVAEVVDKAVEAENKLTAAAAAAGNKKGGTLGLKEYTAKMC